MCGGDFFCCLFICFVLFVCCKVQSPQPKRKKNSETKIKKNYLCLHFALKLSIIEHCMVTQNWPSLLKFLTKGKK